MIKIILKTCLLIYVFLITSSAASVLEMKCTGALMHHIDVLVNLCDETYEVKYQFPCMDRQNNPQYVMVLKTDQTSYMSDRTIHIYKFDDLMKGMFENIKPIFKYPQKQASIASGPASDINTSSGTPFCFHQGLYYLIKNQKLWHIYQGNNRNPYYKGKSFPWFFQQKGNYLTYAINNKIFSSNNSTIYNGNFDIIAYDFPDNDHKLINFYNANHNPDIVLHLRSGLYKIKDSVSELYPKFSKNKQYFAYFRNRLDQKDVWDIVVCKTTAPNKSIAVIPNAKMYDINETAFFYHDSLQWLDSRLYYMKQSSSLTMKQNSSLTIFEYTPQNNSYQQIILSGNSQSKTYQNIESINITIDIMLTDWFQVAKNDKGDLIFIVECLIRTMSSSSFMDNKSTGFIDPVRRIVLFQ